MNDPPHGRKTLIGQVVQKGAAGALDSTSRPPTKRNAVDIPGFAPISCNKAQSRITAPVFSELSGW
jgi:hypothetical protein